MSPHPVNTSITVPKERLIRLIMASSRKKGRPQLCRSSNPTPLRIQNTAFIILQKFFHLFSLLRLGMATWEDITAGAQRWKWPEGTPCVHTRVTTSKPQVRCKAVHMFCKWKVGPFYLLTGGRRGGRLVQPPGSPHRGSKHAPASTTPSIRTLSIAFPFTLLEYCGPFTSGRTVQS